MECFLVWCVRRCIHHIVPQCIWMSQHSGFYFVIYCIKQRTSIQTRKHRVSQLGEIFYYLEFWYFLCLAQPCVLIYFSVLLLPWTMELLNKMLCIYGKCEQQMFSWFFLWNKFNVHFLPHWDLKFRKNFT